MPLSAPQGQPRSRHRRSALRGENTPKIIGGSTPSCLLCCVARRRRETQLHVSPTTSQLTEWMKLDHIHFAAVEQNHLREMNQRKKALDNAVEQVKRLRRQETGEG
ncbi:hypothetical protein [Paenibacillus sp. OK003]|uniref:hypothetical protein n=1 Tax=Paenibacillus sp. OK003 TaxID=1884380 RepID=UPI0015872F79|nr:hypothetical protein [Paenibacillus sp. OK003]